MRAERMLLLVTAAAGALGATAQEDGDVAARVANARARLAALETRAARIDDINEIENLQRSYGYYVDELLWDEVVDLFDDDATMEIGPSGVYVGKDSIRRYLLSLSGGRQGPIEGELYEHMQLQPIVTVAPDGSSAKGRWRALIMTGTHGAGSGGSWGEGTYENEYVKEDGVWKIEKLHWYTTFIAPYEGGWLNADAEAVNRYALGRGVEPDRPPSERYEPYPGVYVPLFHYENPARTRQTPPCVSCDSSQTGTRSADDAATAIGQLENAVAAAKVELERLDDVDALENLAGVYGHYVDKNRHDDVADLFTPDGVVEILGRGVFIGQDRVRQYMRNLSPIGPREGALFNHFHVQPVIDIAPDGMTAHVRARLFVMFGIYQTNAQWGSGIYENVLVKQDGVWKFDYLHGYQSFYTLYEDGWAKRSSAIFAPYDRLPPDRPQSVPYDPYPAAFVPPFHYRNPVSGRGDHYGDPVWRDSQPSAASP